MSIFPNLSPAQLYLQDTKRNRCYMLYLFFRDIRLNVYKLSFLCIDGVLNIGLTSARGQQIQARNTDNLKTSWHKTRQAMLLDRPSPFPPNDRNNNNFRQWKWNTQTIWIWKSRGGPSSCTHNDGFVIEVRDVFWTHVDGRLRCDQEHCQLRGFIQINNINPCF